MTDPKSILWKGKVGADLYRVVSYDDSYDGDAYAVEWADGDAGRVWVGVSYGKDQDAPEVAEVAAHLATINQELMEVLGRYVTFHSGHVLPRELGATQKKARTLLARAKGDDDGE